MLTYLLIFVILTLLFKLEPTPRSPPIRSTSQQDKTSQSTSDPLPYSKTWQQRNSPSISHPLFLKISHPLPPGFSPQKSHVSPEAVPFFPWEPPGTPRSPWTPAPRLCWTLGTSPKLWRSTGMPRRSLDIWLWVKTPGAPGDPFLKRW